MWLSLALNAVYDLLGLHDMHFQWGQSGGLRRQTAVSVNLARADKATLPSKQGTRNSDGSIALTGSQYVLRSR